MAEDTAKVTTFKAAQKRSTALSSAAMPKEMTPPKPCFICFLANS